MHLTREPDQGRVLLTGLTGFVGDLLRLVIVILAGIASASAQGASPGEGGGDVSRPFATHLDRPEAVVPLSDDAVLVAERSGRVLRFDGGTRTDLGMIIVPGTHVFYVPERPYTEGLKDLIAVPSRPGMFLWGMTTGSAEALRWTVGRARIEMGAGEPATIGSEILWQSEPQPWTRGTLPPFSGCRMVIDGDDVVVAVGANSRTAGSGRIVRISLSAGHAPQVVSTGHRNPSGVIFKSGVLWEVEHGPKGGDELNIIVPGGDYGWPDVSQGEPDDENYRSFLRSRPGSIDPVVTWTPAIAPSSITDWRGKFYVGALKGEAVIELTMNGNAVVSQRRILELGKRIRDVRVGVDGRVLWVLTDGPDAELFQVTPNQVEPDSR